MHVLQLGPYPPPEGGVTRNLLAIRDALRAGGHRCSVVVTAKSEASVAEADVHHPRSALALIRLLRTLEYDVLHIHVGGDITDRLMRLMFACCTLGKGKKVLTMHSGGYPSSPEGMTAKPKSVRGRIFRMFDRVISVNKAIAEVFSSYGLPVERNLVILPHALRNPYEDVALPEALASFVSSHRPLLFTACALESDYDLMTQIESLGEVLERFPNAGLVIAGSGSQESELRKAIESKPYADKILLAGNVSHDMALHLIRSADALLRTTLFDGDAIAIREAIFLGTHVIATDNGMRPDGVRLIPVKDKTALAEAIIGISSSPKLEKPNRPDDYSNIDAVVDLYTELVGKV